MKYSVKSFVAGAVCASMIATCAVTAGAAYKKTATLDYPGIKIVVDGKQITPKTESGKTVEPFAIDGTTYLPVRAISNSLGMAIDWDGKTKSVLISSNQAGDKAASLLKYYKLLEEQFAFLRGQFFDLSTDKLAWYTDTNTIIGGSTYGDGMNNSNKAKMKEIESWYSYCYSSGYLNDKAISCMSECRRLSGILESDINKLQNYPSAYNISSVHNSAENNMWSASSNETEARSHFWVWYNNI